MLENGVAPLLPGCVQRSAIAPSSAHISYLTVDKTRSEGFKPHVIYPIHT